MKMVERMDLVERIVSEHGHGVSLERSREDASYATDRALPHAQAKALAAALRVADIEANTVVDQEDRSVSWIYVAI